MLCAFGAQSLVQGPQLFPVTCDAMLISSSRESILSLGCTGRDLKVLNGLCQVMKTLVRHSDSPATEGNPTGILLYQAWSQHKVVKCINREPVGGQRKLKDQLI